MNQADVHPARLDDEALLRQCTVRRGKASGPGGQRRNKVETAVQITHAPTGATAAASERRGPEDNRRAALRRLRMQLALAQRTEPGPTPSRLWRSRVRDQKIALNPGHPDAPAMLAEALDMIEACRADVAKAARRLDVTTSQLVKLLKIEPKALEQVNRARQQRGEGPLR